MQYLGHVVSEAEVRVDRPKKVQAVLDWPIPTNVKQLRGFLNLIVYYRKFVHKYAHIAYPLTELLKKEGFHWTLDVEEAFTSLKKAMTQTPVLSLTDFTQPLWLTPMLQVRG